MVLETETEKLITISLDKIASYRSQRGSSNLHKNVLIANVLRRVRNSSVDEMNVSNDEGNEISNGEAAAVEENNDQEDSEIRPNEVFSCLDTHADDVSESRGLSPDDVNDVSMVGNSESSNDLQSTNEDVRTTRCLKRRQSDEDEPSTRKKRRKEDLMDWRVRSVSDCDSDSDSESYADCDLDVDTADNSMDVEQICGLVSVFRSSFQGLGFLENSRADLKTCTSKTELRRGYSLPDLCAKQAVDGLSSRESFKMCTPILALTV